MGTFFWGLNSIDGESLKTQLLLRRATRGWKSESVSKIGECDGENIIIFITIQRAVIIFRIPMPLAKNFLERKNEEFLFYCPEINGAKRVLTQILERRGVCILEG